MEAAQLSRHGSERALGDGEGQRGLACCSPWGHTESDTIVRLNTTSLEGSGVQAQHTTLLREQAAGRRSLGASPCAPAPWNGNRPPPCGDTWSWPSGPLWEQGVQYVPVCP